MRKIHFSIFVLAVLLGGSLWGQSQKELSNLMRNRGEYYFTITIDNPSDAQILSEICSVDGVKGKTIVCYANQLEYDKLLNLGYKPELQTPPSLREEAVMWKGGDRATYEWNSYLTYDQYVSMMEGFPTQALSDRTCTLIDLGQLSTSNHRHLYGIRIYKGEPYGKPRFLYSSTMHGDEVTGMILMLRLIDELCTSTDSRIVNLLNDVDIYIFPCNNPDGTYAGGNNTVTGATRANGNSVDLNRNYKDYFNGDHPNTSTYQNETQWTMAQADELLFTMAANYHGGAEVMNYCWDWVFQDHADLDWWEDVCTEYVQIARQTYSSYMTDTYTDGVTNGATWYSITGSRQDYMNGYGQCREVTVECSTTKTPNASQLPNFWNYNHNSMLALMEQARNGVHGVVYDASTGQTIQGVTVSVLNHDIHNSYVTTHEVGDFHRPIKGGTYTFVFDKEGYARKFVEVTVGDSQRVDLTVNLSPSSTTQTECYEQVNAASIVAGPYLMGYLNGSTLIMPKHDDRSTSTSVSVSTTSLSVTPTDDGFTLPYDFDRQTIKIALEPSGTNGQYHILYKGRMLQRSNSSLVWAKPSNASGNGVSLTPYNWYVNASGVYYQSGSTKYYLNYSNGSFTTSTSNANNITFYRERECPPVGLTVQASYDHLSGTVTFSSGGNNGTELIGLEGGETVTVSVSANEGYSFSSISATDYDNNPVNLTPNGNGAYSFTMPEADVTVSVAFDAIDYIVNVANDLHHGTVLVNGSSSLCDAHAGQTINVTATPDAGFELSTLYYIAEGSSTEVYFTGSSFTMPANNVTVYASFAKDCGGEITYERVTEAPADWSGTYLLVYQSSTTANSGYAFNGSVTGGDGYSTSITISNGTTISELGGAAELTIEKISGSDYYYIKNGSNYLYAQTTSLYEGTSASGNTYQWSLTMSGNYVNIHTAASSYQLYFNTSSGGTYYQRIYPASQNSTNLYLYRKTINSSAATVSFSPTSGTALSAGNRTVTLTSSIAGLPIYYTTDGTEPTMASTHDTSPVTLRFSDAVTVKAFVYDDPENDGCGIGLTATATYSWSNAGHCYDHVTTVSASNYVMGNLNGTTLVMPTHNNASTVTTTSTSVTITDNGFTAQEELPQVTLTSTGTNGQYYIQYNGKYLARSGRTSTTLTWGNNTSTYGRWTINSNGIYNTYNSNTYYLYYNNNGSFQLSTSQQNNITFYTEGNCPEVSSYTIAATATPAEGGSIDGADLYFEGETCSLTATANDGYTFVNWTESGKEVSTEITFSFEVTGNRTLVANFVLETVTQTMSLTAGWNWWSTNLDITMEQLKAALEAAGIEPPITIKSQNNGSSTFNGTTWRGQLTSLDVNQMYKIQTSSEFEITLTGTPIVPAEHPITIKNGNNWIVYPLSDTLTVNEVFGAFAAVGDAVKSANGSAVYAGNGNWRGKLVNLIPGQGYVYYSTTAEDRTFTFGSTNK